MNLLLTNVEKAIVELEARLEILNIELKSKGFNSIEHIKSRIKSNESIKAKLNKKGLEYTTENVRTYIRDLGGVRATVLFVDDIYRIFNFIKFQKDFEITRVKDYIKTPKQSGYQSLHMNILIPIQTENGIEKVEIELQVRTTGMDFFASVEHLLQYKNDKELDDSISKRLFKCSKMVSALDKELYDIYRILSS